MRFSRARANARARRHRSQFKIHVVSNSFPNHSPIFHVSFWNERRELALFWFAGWGWPAGGSLVQCKEPWRCAVDSARAGWSQRDVSHRWNLDPWLRARSVLVTLAFGLTVLFIAHPTVL